VRNQNILPPVVLYSRRQHLERDPRPGLDLFSIHYPPKVLEGDPPPCLDLLILRLHLDACGSDEVEHTEVHPSDRIGVVIDVAEDLQVDISRVADLLLKLPDEAFPQRVIALMRFDVASEAEGPEMLKPRVAVRLRDGRTLVGEELPRVGVIQDALRDGLLMRLVPLSISPAHVFRIREYA